MRRRIFALVVLINTFILLFGAQSQAVAGDSILNRQRAAEMVMENSTAIWKAEETENFGQRDYDKQVLKSKGVDTRRIFLFVHPFTDKDVYYYYDPFEQMNMRLLKEFVPEQMRYVWEMKKMMRLVTENIMANTADDLFQGLYGTYQSKLLAEKSLEISREAYERERVRYENGLITPLELEEAELSFIEAENALSKADRDFENMHRQFNSVAGLDIDYRYEVIGTPWFVSDGLGISEEDAVKDALSNRFEIWDLKQQIQLIEFQMEIYRHKDVHLKYPDAREDYQELQDDLDELNIKLSMMEYDIEKEIRKAYQELSQCYTDLELTRINLERQKNQLETVTAQFESGLVPESVVEQLEQVIKQLEYAVNMNTITVLNKIDKFNRSIAVGSSY